MLQEIERKLRIRNVVKKPSVSKFTFLADHLISSQDDFKDYQEGSLDYEAWARHIGSVIQTIAIRCLYWGIFTGVVSAIMGACLIKTLWGCITF